MSQRGRPFQPGNTFGRGRPRGSGNKVATKLHDLLETYGDSLIRKSIAEALQGDTAMRRLLVTRLLAGCSGASAKLRRLPLRTAADVVKASEAVVHDITTGTLTPDAGQKIIQILDFHRKAIETQDLEKRISLLESKP
jgi:hypothetical protein